MIVLGNDIVDLMDPDSDPTTLHPRFLDRAFGAEEREWMDAENTGGRSKLWIRWAAREAAFKALRQWDPDAPCSWQEFVVDMLRDDRLTVRHPRGSFSGLVVQVPGAAVQVVCTASGDRQEPAGSGLMLLEEALGRVHVFCAEVEQEALRGRQAPSESELLRGWAKDRIAKTIGLSKPAVILETPRGVPYLAVNGIRRGTLSLSHHGRFLAAAYLDGR